MDTVHPMPNDDTVHDHHRRMSNASLASPPLPSAHHHHNHLNHHPHHPHHHHHHHSQHTILTSSSSVASSLTSPTPSSNAAAAAAVASMHEDRGGSTSPHIPGPHACSQCSASFPARDLLEKHELLHSTNVSVVSQTKDFAPVFFSFFFFY